MGKEVAKKESLLLSFLHEAYPNASCSLHFQNDFECLVAIILSAQSKDESVNKVTPLLFSRYPDAERMAEAPLSDLEMILRTLGLYRNKTKNLLALSKTLIAQYGGKVPSTKEELLSLPGVGIKTAGVFLLERREEPHLPVDTHIERIAKRLSFAKKSQNGPQIEALLEKRFPKEEWIFLHHALIAFGRTRCLAKNPLCEDCPLRPICAYRNKEDRRLLDNRVVD